MNYLVTGATGFIGSRLVYRLLSAGHRVRILARKPDAARKLEAAGVQVFAGDVTERDHVLRAMEGVDGVFHVAGWYAIGHKNSAGERTNVEGTRIVLETARDLAVNKVVYTSTIAVYGDTGGRLVDEKYFYDGPALGWASAYDRSKWRAHYQIARPLAEEGLPLVIVLPGLVYGPGDHSAIGNLLRDLLRGRPLPVPIGTTYCWSHVDDVAEAHHLAMERGLPGEDYIVSGEPATLVEVLRRARRWAGSRAPIVPLPRTALRAMSLLAQPFNAWLPPTYTSEGLRVATVSYTASNHKARTQLGYTPRPLEQGLPPTLAALRNEIMASSK